MGKVTKGDLNKMFWRLNLFQTSWNYERMQSLGYLNTMTPVLKRVYEGKSNEEKEQAINRHLEFFNTMPTFAAPILGINAALEEKEGNKAASIISTLKVALMGPLAGLGDSVVWLTWMPICMSIGASFCAVGNPLGLIIAFIMFNLVNQGIKYFGIHIGYKEGTKFLDNVKESRLIQRYSTMAGILGLMIVGGLVPQMVNLNLAFQLNIGDMTVSIQELLDGIIPKMLPMGLTLFCAWLVHKRVNTVLILVSMLVIGVILAALGVIA